MSIEQFMETDTFKLAEKIFVSINGGPTMPFRKKHFAKLKDNEYHNFIVIGSGHFPNGSIEIDLMEYEKEDN